MPIKKFLVSHIILLIFVFSSNVSAQPSIAIKPVITGLSNPVAITHAGDGSDRLFISLQSGRIVIYNGLQLLPAPFLDISPLVSTNNEQGLLSVAFHPDYANNGFIFVNYTNTDGATVIARYRISSDPDIVDAATGSVLLTVPQPYANHNGGQLQFGPDGYLYIGMGDGGAAGDPLDNAQNTSKLLGKILRLDVDNGFPYQIPPDNPFVGAPQAQEEIWALGLRNPWRFSFDRENGDMFIADVGQANWEEINFQSASSGGGENYGWRLMEASYCYNPPDDCNDGSLVLPILEYDHSSGNCSITGGYIYRGTRNPKLSGIYFYGDFCSGRIWGAVRDNMGAWSSMELLDTGYRISTFGEDETGEIYFAHRSLNEGAIYQIDQANLYLPHLPLLLLD